MSDSLPPIVLNAHQRRHFEVLFARLEDSLTRIEALLDPDETRGQVLTHDERDVAPGFRDRAIPVIDTLRGQVKALSAVLELRPHRVSRARTIAATLSAEVIRIEDSLSSQMRGYGAVDPSVPEHLDPALKAMARTLGALAAALTRRPPPPATPKR